MRGAVLTYSLLLVLTLVLSAGNGACSAPTGEQLTKVPMPNQDPPALSESDAERTSLRVDNVMDEDVPEERGMAELGVRVDEAFTKLKANLSMQKLKDFIRYIKDKLVTSPKKIYDAAWTKFAAEWGKHADAKAAFLALSQTERDTKIAQELMDKRAPLSDLAKHNIPPDIYKKRLGVDSIRDRSAVKDKDVVEKLALADAYEKLYLLGFRPSAPKKVHPVET